MNEHVKDAFSIGQERWIVIKNSPGFVAQYCGWSTGNGCIAHIIGFWNDRKAYNQFMHANHDAIYEKTGQSGTIESIHVEVVEVEVVHSEEFAKAWLLSKHSVFLEKWTIKTERSGDRE
ncbi:DUF4937 domain-containing protein [Pseudalkalibacillus hwajinpoensis]|uniref:DUF4937 domain-containing protein n=1 Tax=Guptibacillus hwajinpoensis TaxID=208199 RepID=UPI00325A8986